MIDMVQILERDFLEVFALCAPPNLIVLPLAAAGFVAPCQGLRRGGQDQLPGTQVKDLCRRRSS
ncbi:hypothetical protein FIV38_21855 [Pseudomonas proteolytica]|nr:hypothetical protein F4W61_19735 [Pseudomonas proteolytica]OHW39949.1 hypothetical protein BHC62_17865 [Pseudomonas sp. 06C 126]QHG24728.1 hypothetical protein GDV60_18445 [Pseudomonas sp. DTU12.1]QJI20342.1 hypothetical protein HKK57_19345 [Pseudomonas sp. ADAK21]QJI24504.1 hypothetical protein HKK56_13745 [Pseudomonas sp. ADAK20]